MVILCCLVLLNNPTLLLAHFICAACVGLSEQQAALQALILFIHSILCQVFIQIKLVLVSDVKCYIAGLFSTKNVQVIEFIELI